MLNRVKKIILSKKNTSIKISLLYLLVGCSWILFSDAFLQYLFQDYHTILTFQVYKGWFYVTVTALMLYSLISAAHAKLCESNEKYEQTLDSTNDIIWEFDFKTKLFFLSQKWSILTKYEETKNIVNFYFWKKITHPADRLTAFATIKNHLQGKTELYSSEYRIKIKSGEYIWILNRGKALKDDKGNLIKLVGSITDISERKKSEEQIRFLAYYDLLTQLPNRALFLEKMNAELEKISTTSQKCALLLLSLNNLKIINDTLGYTAGDKLLTMISEKLKSCLPSNASLFKIDNDEFILLLPNVKDIGDFIVLANTLMNIFQNPLYILENEIIITANAGITVCPDDGMETLVLLKNLHTAVHTAMESGKYNYQIFDSSQREKLVRKTTLEKDLKKSIQYNELILYYQPQIDAHTGNITGFESLVRWNHPKFGMISPSEFIPLAEESGFIVPMGEWILKTSCEQIKKWHNEGFIHLNISVNVSAVQLQYKNFLKVKGAVLEKFNLHPRFLELEITESVLIKSLHSTMQLLNAIKEEGIQMALDDFGTGYSSLSYLKSLPIDTLKIDKSFIDDIGISPDGEAIIEGLLLLAHKLHLQVVAEGVETQKQFEFLKKRNCDKIQGYFFSRPVPSEKATEFLEKGFF